MTIYLSQHAAALPSSILLYHQFDGVAAAPLGNTVPQHCYDPITQIVGAASFTLDGSGYLQTSANGYVTIDPGGRWPSRVGKTRHYLLWGRCTAALVSADYIPHIFINYKNTNDNFVCFRCPGNSSIYVQSYRFLNGAVVDITGGSGISLTGAFKWTFHVEDHGDWLVGKMSIILESTQNSDIATVTQVGSNQMYVASRLHTEEQIIKLGWEAVTPTKFKIRGIQVWDSSD